MMGRLKEGKISMNKMTKSLDGNKLLTYSVIPRKITKKSCTNRDTQAVRINQNGILRKCLGNPDESR